MKTIIVDDEPMPRMALRNILREHFPHVTVVAECKNVPEAVKQIQALRPEVVFLDVEMPEYNGFDLLNFFRPEHIDFQIIFITAYSEYALQAFEISAVDYLLKPLRIEHLERALKKLKTNATPEAQKYEVLREHTSSPDADKKIVLQTSENIFIIKVADILYLEAEGSYTNFVIQNQQNILISKRLAEFEYLEQLPQFFRSHRSYLINTNKIRRVDKKDCVIEMENGAMVYLAQERKKNLLEKIES